MSVIHSLKETFGKLADVLLNLPEFMEGMKEELGRLTWPDWNSLIAGTVGVIAISLFTTLYIWISDMLISKVLLAILGG
ncbi:MAG: preprotein translocase subunit SecE [Thermotogae bacterium]|nr:preprotein translocase subunit SecE [Thermotogota bacterium]